MVRQRNQNIFVRLVKGLTLNIFAVIGALGLTLAFFMVLPLMQTLTKPPTQDLVAQEMDVSELEPPPPVIEEQEPEEPEEPEEQPELNEEAPPLTLEQLALAMNPGLNDGWMEGSFAVNLNNVVSEKKEVDALFSIADLDQKPRIIYQPGPMLTKEVLKKAPGKVYIIFVVDQNGRVQDPQIQTASDPVFEKPALDAIKKWKFEPGKRSGQPVRFRMRVPFTFPKG